LVDDIAELADGSILGYGTRSIPGSREGFAFKVSPTGQLDSTFDGDGIAVPAGLPFQDIRGVDIDSSGNLLVIARNQLVRFLATGARDPSFGASGTLAVSNNLLAAVPVSGGRIVLLRAPCAVSDPTCGQHYVVERYNASGTQDLTFPARTITGQFPMNGARLLRLNGDIVVAGGNDGTPGLSNSKLIIAPTGALLATVSLDGELLASAPDGGFYMSWNASVRRIGPTFGIDSTFTTAPGFVRQPIGDVVVDPLRNRVVVAGPLITSDSQNVERWDSGRVLAPVTRTADQLAGLSQPGTSYRRLSTFLRQVCSGISESWASPRRAC
jgi:hypothetical protein